MCSPNSPASPETASLVDALAAVAESSLFAFCDPCDAATFLDLLESHAAVADGEVPGPRIGGDPSGAASPWMRAAVQFHGGAFGWIAVTLPTALARALCAAFAGDDDTSAVGDDAMGDFAGELANMTCGLWLTRSTRQQLVELDAPRVTWAHEDDVRRLARSADDRQVVFATLNEIPVLIEVGGGAER
jgi:hypothetical protein